jgi:hypothetical protein
MSILKVDAIQDRNSTVSINPTQVPAYIRATPGTLSNPARSGRELVNYDPTLPNGLYYITSGGITQQVYVDIKRGGWMLVASNRYGDTVIPSGTARLATGYELDRGGLGALGTPNPENDYIIGNIITTLPFSSVRVLGWGLSDVSNAARTFDSESWGTYIDVRWPLSLSGANRLTEVQPRSATTICGSSSLASLAAYFILDCIKVNRLTSGGYDANADQVTIGGAAVTASTGDASGGTYMGHGTGEGSTAGEGWYDSSNTSYNCRSYTTWVL